MKFSKMDQLSYLPAKFITLTVNKNKLQCLTIARDHLVL